MDAVYDFLANYMGYVITFFCNLFSNNFAIAIFIFTLVINLVFSPLNIKQQLTTAKQARMKNKLAKLKEKYKDDKAKYNEEMTKLYSEGGTNPLSGCLLLFIRLPFFFGIYGAIQKPLSYLLRIPAETIEAATKVLGLNASDRGFELSIMNGVSKLTGAEFAGLKDAVDSYNFTFFGIDLTRTPEFTLELGKAFSDPEIWTLWLIPLLSFATAMLSAVVSSLLQKRNNPDAPGGMAGLFLLMPLLSLWIAFSVPCAVGFYWACSNFVAMLLQIAMQLLYSPARVIARTEAKEALARRAAEQKKIAAVDGGAQ